MRYRCVVVTDDFNFVSIAAALKRFVDGRDILHADSGMAALRLLAKPYCPTVVLLDLPLADMSGAEFIESIECEHERVAPVAIVCLVGARDRTPRRARRVVAKPLGAHDLVAAVTSAAEDLPTAACAVASTN